MAFTVGYDRRKNINAAVNEVISSPLSISSSSPLTCMFDSLSLLLYSFYYESKITRTELLAQETEHEEEGTLGAFEVSFIGLQLYSSPILRMLSAQEMSWSSHSRTTEENTYQTSKTLPHLNSLRMVFTIILFLYDGRTAEWDESERSKTAIHISVPKQTKWCAHM